MFLLENEGIESNGPGPPPWFCHMTGSIDLFQIRVLGFTRVTNSFDARKHCDRRRYEYILPAFMFDPAFRAAETNTPIGAAGGPLVLGPGTSTGAQPGSDPAQEPAAAAPSADAALDAATSKDGSGNAEGDAGTAAGSDEGTGAAPEPAQLSEEHSGHAPKAQQQESAQQQEPAGSRSADTGQSEQAPDGNAQAKASASAQDERPSVRRSAADGAAAAAAAEAAGSRQCMFSEEQQARLNEVLGAFEGTHSFHNYTVRVPASDPAAKRYILSFKCAGTMELEVGPACTIILSAACRYQGAISSVHPDCKTRPLL